MAVFSSASDAADDDYDSDEDDEATGTAIGAGGSVADRDGSFGSGTGNQEESDDDGDDDSADDDGADDRWDSVVPDVNKMPTIKEVTSTALPTSTDVGSKGASQKADDKSSAASASEAAAAVDPYFTHFDPRAEHQSYKVKVRALSQYICTPPFRCGPSRNGMPMDFFVFVAVARSFVFGARRTPSSGWRKRIARR